MGKINWDDLQSEKSYGPMGAYSQSKLANILFTIELAKRLENTGVTTVCLHPGFVQTEIFRDREENSWTGFFLKPIINFAVRFFSKTTKDGAATTIYCAVDDDIPNKNGLYFE